MRVVVLVLSVALSGCLGCVAPGSPMGSSEPVPDPTRVGFAGYRGVEVGMTPGEASSAFGEPLAPATPPGQEQQACHRLFPGGRPGAVAFMVHEGTIVRIEIRGPGVLTSRGVGVGSLEAEAASAYPGEVATTPHKYDPVGHYLTVEGPNRLELIFETDGSRVSEYRVGRLPEVEWVEGCL